MLPDPDKTQITQSREENLLTLAETNINTSQTSHSQKRKIQKQEKKKIIVSFLWFSLEIMAA